MAQNFQPHMGGPGQMMQRPPGQRPPPGPPNNATTQIQQVIYQTVSSNTSPNLVGWQSNTLIQERIGLIFNLIGNLRLASQNTQAPPGLNKMIEIGIKFEKEIFEKSPDKDTYTSEIKTKLEQLLERRNQNAAGLQQSINNQAQAQAHAQQQQVQQQQLMMNQNSMQGQPTRNMPQQGFQHLQHQMQASPLPGQQPQMHMGMGNDGLPPNMTPNQQQFQIPMQQPQQPQPQPNGPPLTPQDNAIVNELAQRLMNGATQEQKNELRNRLNQSMDPQILQGYVSRGQDPLVIYFRNQALNRYREQKKSRMLQQAQAQQTAISQQGQNLAAPPMQQQRSVNPSPLNGQSQPPISMGGNAEFGGFLGNMDNLTNQQKQAINAQESGQVVVPASGAPRNATPQPGAIPGQQMANINNRAQQQHMLMQQQRMHAAQQQQQQQSRAMAQSKVPQMGLQGQPGGMGNGPMPPQPSPAMATLNAPLRTPSQMSHAEPQPANPSAAFGQPLDPRFAGGNQRLAGPNAMNAAGLNPAILAGMTQQEQQQVIGLPPDKLNEVLSKWNEQRAQMNNPNMQAGRPPVSMPGTNQARPGMPQGPFNPAGQFNMNGQRPPGAPMTNNMTPQQSAQLQAQLARLQANPLQQRNGPPMVMPNDQRTMAQMDNVDFPPTLQGHQAMPRGVPPEIKKWGALKNWTQQNPNLGPEVLENLRNLQRMHLQQILRNKAQAGQAGVMQPGIPGGPGTMPSIPAGMSAPVAPMGQTPLQFPNGMNMPGQGQIRQPTPQEINAVRNHPSGKMMTANDDQIRMFLIRQMQQRQHQAAMTSHMQNAPMQNPMSQANRQQPGQPQTNPNGARGPNQVPQAPPQAPKQPPAAEQAASLTNANRATRPQPTARNAAVQNSSPPQPANKKRASSDDVVEVPNPNAQQSARAGVQQPQGQQAQTQKQPPQQGRALLTPAQIAALNPDERQRYEQSRTVPDTPENERIKILSQEEAQNVRNLPMIPMDQETRANVLKALREVQPILVNMSRAIGKWFQYTHDENRARAFVRFKYKYTLQFRGDNAAQPRNGFSLTLKDIDQAKALLNSMIKDLSDRFPGMKRPNPDPTQSQTTLQPPSRNAQPIPAPPAQLSAANLQQLNKMHQRSGSRGGSLAPAAPTSSQPPFQFGAGSPPPNGVPAYPNDKPPVTRETLHLPAKKRQKQETMSKSSVGQSSSPNNTKPMSPEMKRQPAEAKQPQKPSFYCIDPDCNRHNIGFESEEALQSHINEEHTIGDPTQFVQQNLSSMLGLDAQGHAAKPTNPQDPTAAPFAPKMSLDGSKQGQTPNVKSENTPTAATPMNRQVSMNRQGSAAGSKTGAPSKSTPSKDNTKTPVSQKDANKTLNQVPKEIVLEDPWANATIDPNDLFQAFQPFESGAGGAISDMNVYRSITPNDTPESSKDGISEPNSDISDGVGLDINLDIFDDTWMPFGSSEADAFLDMSSFNVAKNNSIEDLPSLDDEQPALNFGSWDDMLDTSAFDKPFTFDPSLFSMNAD